MTIPKKCYISEANISYLANNVFEQCPESNCVFNKKGNCVILLNHTALASIEQNQKIIAQSLGIHLSSEKR